MPQRRCSSLAALAGDMRTALLIRTKLYQIAHHTGGARLSKKRSEDALQERWDKAVGSTIIRPDASAGLTHCVRNAAPEQYEQDNSNNQDMPDAKTEHSGLQAATELSSTARAPKQVGGSLLVVRTFGHGGDDQLGR
jgi:hypothetical protein